MDIVIRTLIKLRSLLYAHTLKSLYYKTLQYRYTPIAPAIKNVLLLETLSYNVTSALSSLEHYSSGAHDAFTHYTKKNCLYFSLIIFHCFEQNGQ